MAAILYNVLSSLGLVWLGLYHLISATVSHVKSPNSYSAKPLYPFPPSSSPSPHRRLRHLPLYLITVALLVAFIHQVIISSETDSLVKGHTPVHRFVSLQFAAVIFLFIILAFCLLLSESSLLPFSNDFIFALGSVLFFLQYSVAAAAASVQVSDLEAKCDSVSARISAFAALTCLVLAFQPKLFAADVGLGAAIFLQGLWVFQTGLTLHVDAFIPEGCHRLLDVVDGVEGSTKCVLDESKLRAMAVLDLIFLVHVMLVVFIVMITLASVAKCVGVRRFGSYDSLPNPSHSENSSIIQMKALTGTQA
ncbi:hypothetical protein QN277_020848 [Acacia crassicarpa]|uniref:Plant viral-response family protein n=1 Tax=Acacia crassicarpa TaxID=499986 RepID=A0AAE1JNU3_9FABA|nr:hypothetical protein QN277_020848 [Acacia crassicarpa]